MVNRNKIIVWHIVLCQMLLANRTLSNALIKVTTTYTHLYNCNARIIRASYIYNRHDIDKLFTYNIFATMI